MTEIDGFDGGRGGRAAGRTGARADRNTEEHRVSPVGGRSQGLLPRSGCRASACETAFRRKIISRGRSVQLSTPLDEKSVASIVFLAESQRKKSTPFPTPFFPFVGDSISQERGAMPTSLSHDKVSIVSGTRCLTFHSPWAQPPITCVTHHHAPSPSADALPHHHVRFAITAVLTHSAVFAPNTALAF